LGEEIVVLVLAHRDDRVQRLIGDNDTGGMHAGVSAHAFELERQIDHLFDDR